MAAAAAAAAAACTTQAGVAGSMELSRLVKCRLVESEAHYIHNLNNTFLLQIVKNLCGECIRLHRLPNLNPKFSTKETEVICVVKLKSELLSDYSASTNI